ncbi:DNA-processing protein DprA [Exiguobacterium acetylicum]|uniref:DNA-processing protein DprA n=1 Tax=Exiguobacterium acetylicum TaxID=41170 RepID=UPI001EE3483E|nr:DNA-processing protein DprA [Exiguobacterium acetylicum]UKS55024.1 DNA-processing protein DprA [Exiguobacterium acetylicum]
MKRELYVRFAMCQVPYTIVQLIEQFGIVPSHELPVSKRLRNRYEQALHLEQIEESILVKGDPLFPAMLLTIPQPVYALFYRGDPSCLTLPRVSIIGSRTPSPQHLSRMRFLQPFFHPDLVTVSGGAYGIDALVHRLSLKHQQKTIAVLAGGLDRLYPTSHSTLFERILSHGLLLSEYPPGTPIQKFQFLERNRIIAGLSSSLIIAEAAKRSGTMNTAGHALDQGKDVYCLPGCPTESFFTGTNQLIAEGAIPLLDPEEVSKSIRLNVDKWESRLL